MQNQVDVLIIGGGPGGSCAATLLARAASAAGCLTCGVADWQSARRPSGRARPTTQAGSCSLSGSASTPPRSMHLGSGGPIGRSAWPWPLLRLAGGFLLLLVLAGCHTPPVLPPIDVTRPGWRIEQGQAVWRPGRGKTEIAGELILALGPDDQALIELSKTPFPVVTAREADGAWLIEFGAGARRYGGRGEPPPLFVWFQVFRARSGRPLASAWRVEHPEGGRWIFTQPRSGQRLEIWPAP